MAIWMDEQEAKTSTRWRRSDLALVATLAVVVALQFAVAIWVFDLRGASAATAAVETIPSTLPKTGATRFSATPINPGYNGEAATAGPAFWFTQGDAVAHVSFAGASQPLIAPSVYAFHAGAMNVPLSEVPVDYRDTETTKPSVARTAVAAFIPAPPAPPSQAGTTGQTQNIAALRTYLGQSGLATMGARCGDLLGQAYKYDGGLIALCRQVRATL